MTRFTFSDEARGEIVLLRMLLSQVTEEELADEGYQFTYKAVTSLLAYIDHLEELLDDSE